MPGHIVAGSRMHTAHIHRPRTHTYTQTMFTWLNKIRFNNLKGREIECVCVSGCYVFTLVFTFAMHANQIKTRQGEETRP